MWIVAKRRHGRRSVISLLEAFPCGTRLVTAARDHAVLLWDAATGRLQRSLGPAPWEPWAAPSGPWAARLGAGAPLRLRYGAVGALAAVVGVGRAVLGLAFLPGGERAAVIADAEAALLGRAGGPPIDPSTTPAGPQQESRSTADRPPRSTPGHPRSSQIGPR